MSRDTKHLPSQLKVQIPSEGEPAKYTLNIQNYDKIHLNVKATYELIVNRCWSFALEILLFCNETA